MLESIIPTLSKVSHESLIESVDYLPVIALQLTGFALIGGIYVFVTGKAARASGERITRAIFPKRLYGSETHVDKWSAFLTILIIIPVLAILAKLIALLVGIDIRSILVGWFGERPVVLHAKWAVVSLQFLSQFVAASFAGYWAHYALHKVPVLWSIHRAHHSAEALTPLANWRAHPIELFWLNTIGSAGGSLGLGFLLYITGTHLLSETTELTLFVTALQEFWFGFLGHSHIPISWGWFNVVI